jgi:exopolysaccharide production protein ExoQ
MIKLLCFLESTFVVVSLLLFSHAFYAFFLNTVDAQAGVESPLLRSIYMFIYVLTFCLLILRWRKTLRLLSKHPWIIVILTFVMLSTLWSAVPDISIRKGIALVGSTAFGIYLGTHFETQDQLKILAWTFGISILASFFLVFLMPKYGISVGATSGNWRGVYLHKSALGERMVISFFTFYFLSKIKIKKASILKIAAVASLILVFFSKSATSLLCAISLYLVAKVLMRLSLRTKTGILFIVTALFLLLFTSSVLAVNLEAFLAANNKNITLTGRTPLWADLWDFVLSNLWLGHGYGAFFSAAHSETQLLWNLHPWKPPHAHNGYLAVILDLGLIGFFAFVIGYFRNIGNCLYRYLLLKDVRLLWVFIFLIYTAVFNFTEVSFLQANYLNWIISVASIYSMSSLSKTESRVESGYEIQEYSIDF